MVRKLGSKERLQLEMNSLSGGISDRIEYISIDDGFSTETSEEQGEVEATILTFYQPYLAGLKRIEKVRLRRDLHIPFLLRGINQLGQGYTSLDASKPWLMYWMLHSLDLLGFEIEKDIIERGISTIARMQNPDGGFGGGPGQTSHLAPTYAAVNSIAILGTEDAFRIINRDTLYAFLMRMKQEDGSFIMHEGGEVDVRGSYCALSVAALTNILTPELEENVAEFVASCQTYEGGIGACPGSEAHGGYNYCGMAALELLGKLYLLDFPRLLSWASQSQMNFEGGFQGRTNKLVDGCYSFWQGGVFPLLESELLRRNRWSEELYGRDALQDYLLVCCQGGRGGMRDKPGKPVDYYHTCYCLSGLSTSQYHILYNIEMAQALEKKFESKVPAGIRSLVWQESGTRSVRGDACNLLVATHPIHNITLPRVKRMVSYFYSDAVVKISPSGDNPLP
ncbi:uncharacterized protein VTP21DRAFT_7278 [Calcarisporiella thermophila]|uniref:uncharacterized protein n=1 Tax=Calcarisporiella thermophila TaxID=911321 RepID=UPI0037444463